MPPDVPALPALGKGSVVTVGTFDGVHRGHREILRRLHERAAASGLPPVVVTFRPHPLEVVQPNQAPELLTPGDEQFEALVDSGPLTVAVVPFDRRLASLSAAAFVNDVLVARYGMRELVIGYNHGFGKGREGDAAALAALGEREGFTVHVVGPTLDAAERPVSSSRIRASIRDCDFDAVRTALGRDYCVRGTVGRGQQRGRTIGYPTLNVVPLPRKLLPPDGVYAVRIQSRRGAFGGMMNVGGRPTFGELDRTVEAHLFDAGGDWYGENVSVAIVRRLRGTMRFSGVEALVAQLGTDAREARIALTQA